MLYDIDIIIDRRDLNEQHAFDLMKTLIASGTDLEKTVFLLAMHMKGVTGQELTGFANAVRSEATIEPVENTSDIVGTGGDGKNTINVSTAASILCAGLGIRMAKHGNRAITSPQGSGDILSKMGYKFEKTREQIIEDIERMNFAYILAPHYNSSFAKFFPARKMLTFKTIMNYLGPITNPCDPDTIVIGSSDQEICALYADFLSIRRKRGFIVHGKDGMDEISPVSETNAILVDAQRKEIVIDPKAIDLPEISYHNISFPDPAKNRQKFLDGLFGRDEKISSFIALNAAPLLMLKKDASDLEEGYSIARDAIKKGIGKKAFKKISGGVERID